jgi:hypothetical protein
MGLFRRRNYLIHPRFQLTIVFVNVFCILLGFTGIFFVVRRFFVDMVDLGQKAGFPPGHPYFEFIDLQMQTFGQQILLAFLASVLVSAVVSIWVSHRAVGPIHKLITYLRGLKGRAANTPVPALKFRKNDLFSELPELVNDAVGANPRKNGQS